MKAHYDNKPSVLEAMGDGSFRYRMNISEETVNSGMQSADDNEAEQQERTQWTCDEVTVWAPITSNKIKQAVMEEFCPPTHELKLTHEYNAAMADMIGESKTSDAAKTAIARYKEFLVNRTEVLALVQSDCDNLGIN